MSQMLLVMSVTMFLFHDCKADLFSRHTVVVQWFQTFLACNSLIPHPRHTTASLGQRRALFKHALL